MVTVKYYSNPDGPTLGISADSGLGIIESDGLYFKDSSRDGQLHPYQDWRLDADTRAKDLAQRMTIEEICGLMMYSGHQAVPAKPGPFCNATFDGVPAVECNKTADELTDQQKEWIVKNGHRHLLLADLETAEDAVLWNNSIQALAETGRFAIPCNTSSDPRHGSDRSAEYNMGSGRVVSLWPEGLGLAACFDPEIARQFGRVVAEEYRALGFTTALSPQVDLTAEPRWSRMSAAYSESPKLAAAYSKAICEGYQTTPGAENGWGNKSINAMPKHWPSGGPEEGGRDAHFAYGKYAVYPGNNFEQHMEPWTKGAFKLEGGTESASAVMPYYTISWGQDKYGSNVGNSYSKYIISDLLRGREGFDGVICTDWGITMDPNERVDDFAHTCWGTEEWTMEDRFYTAIDIGIDQFGDVNSPEMMIKAYHRMVEEKGQDAADARFRLSAVRILKNIFRVGLFENPYLDMEQSLSIVGCDEFVKAGFEAQKKSVILLKNKDGILPMVKGKKVYIPRRYTPAGTDWFGNPYEESWSYPIDMDAVKEYYTVVDSPADADFAIVPIRGPQSGNGYSRADLEAGGNGYMPISLQYRPYTATAAREVSIAGGDPRESFTNRSYLGKTVTASNESDLDMVLDTKKAMGDKPVITVLQFSNPVVPAEFEPSSDAVVAHCGVNAHAALQVICGEFEPSGLLPVQMPANMDTVELQCEDLPFDMECYTDSCGNSWDFAFGMNFGGVIEDERTKKYR